VVLYGTTLSASIAKRGLCPPALQKGAIVPCKWWARLRLQHDAARLAQACSEVFAREGACSAAADVLISAACGDAWRQVVNGVESQLSRADYVACGLTVLQVIASEAAPHEWVWARRKEVFDILKRLISHSSLETILHVSKLLCDNMCWHEEALQLIKMQHAAI
jgi:hypothetical protein